MRILLFASCLCILFAGCNKKNTYSICDMTQVEIINEGSPTAFINYQYDAAGRVKKVFYGAGTDDYAYFPDSVVVTTTSSNIPPGYGRMTYFLNSAGLATSAKRTFNPNPNGIQFDDVYTYDAAGYLIAERSIFSQLYNGNILRDTTYRTYTVMNGDIVKKTETNSTDVVYEYSADAMPDNIPYLNNFPSREGSFLGKHPVHLMSKGEGSNSYSFDRGKKVSQMNVTFQGTTTTTKVLFHYACD
jgi:hypothetical protein